MDSLLETIRAATESGASTDQKAAGVQACRTIIAALDTEPATPLTPPTTPVVATRPSIDQVLDMMIAKLTSIASEQDKRPTPALPVPNGLRVPVAKPVPRVAAKPAAVAKVPAKRKP
jgi:hypothetical protein